MVIRILDYVRSASTYEDGEVIYGLISRELKHGRKVSVSFEGIPAVPSAFVNAAFVRLLDDLPFEEIRARLHIERSTKHINELLRSRFKFAANEAPAKH